MRSVEGINKELGLPFAKMRTIRVAFDVDGTLRCNCTETCQDLNKDIVELYRILKKFKNTEIWIWSGGGKDYALQWAHRLELDFNVNRCISKIGAPQMDIAIDDIQDTALGNINLIVREK